VAAAELGDQHPGQDEAGAEPASPGQALAGKQEPEQAGEHRLHGEDDGGGVGDTSRWARVWTRNAPAEAATEVMARATHTWAEAGATRSPASPAQARAASPAVASWTTASR
jgi:hypothetical protein